MRRAKAVGSTARRTVNEIVNTLARSLAIEGVGGGEVGSARPVV